MSFWRFFFHSALIIMIHYGCIQIVDFSILNAFLILLTKRAMHSALFVEYYRHISAALLITQSVQNATHFHIFGSIFFCIYAKRKLNIKKM